MSANDDQTLVSPKEPEHQADRDSAKPVPRPKLLAGKAVPRSEPHATAPLPDALPPRAGPYRLGSAIGKGGFGVVYRAEHVAHGTLAAVKIPHPELAESPSAFARFEREINVVRRLRHPNIIEILDYGSLDDGRPYFAMELLSGVDLEEHLRRRGRLSAEEAREILEALVLGLEAAHAAAVVHRDIKPSNVFLADAGGERRVVLLDFGIAKVLDVSEPALTTSRAVLGTVACISPEQLVGASIDLRTDIYALGTLLYAMVTGALPYGDVPLLALRGMLFEGRVPRPSARARVGRALEEVILRAMSLSPEARYPSAVALLEAARRAIEHDEGRMPPPATVAVTRRAIGIYLEALAEADALAEGDEALVADVEELLRVAITELGEVGFTMAIETGTSALLVAACPAGMMPGAERTGGAVSAALALHQRLLGREGRDPRVQVHLCLNEGPLLVDAITGPVGGELLDPSAWVPERPEPGVYVSERILAELGAGETPTGRESRDLLRLDSMNAEAPASSLFAALAACG